MYLKNLLFILFVSYLATLLRLYLDNNFIISLVGSFCFGFIVARNFSNSTNKILLFGFCSCFTSFSGFIFFLYKLLIQGEFIRLFLYSNLVIIMNLILMQCGFMISRKIT